MDVTRKNVVFGDAMHTNLRERLTNFPTVVLPWHARSLVALNRKFIPRATVKCPAVVAFCSPYAVVADATPLLEEEGYPLGFALTLDGSRPFRLHWACLWARIRPRRSPNSYRIN